MDTREIKRAFKNIADRYKAKNNEILFTRVCACDQLPRRVPVYSDVIIIFNTDESTGKGQHWCAIYLPKKVGSNREGFFFDSYGLKVNNQYAEDFLNRNCDRLYYNKMRLQGDYSFMCGEFSIMFCEASVMAKSHDCFFNQFSGENLMKNDQKVRDLFNWYFKEKGICGQTCKSYIKCINASKQQELITPD